MKRLKYFFFLPASVVLLILACNKTTTNPLQSGNWVTRPESDANARYQAISFVVGDTAYIGTGYDGQVRYNDLWSFDTTNSWQYCPSMPSNSLTGDSAPARNGAVAFSIGRVGYITTGTDGYNKFLDTWAYNVDTRTWNKKANFGNGGSNPVTTGRYGASAFTIGNYGYVTSGYDGDYLKDLWQYDPSKDQWIPKQSIGNPNAIYPVGGKAISQVANKRMFGLTFVYTTPASGTTPALTQGYVVTGLGSGGTNVNDFWSYNPITNTWTGLSPISNLSSQSYDDDYSDIVRNSGVAMVMGTEAFITLGVNGGYNAKTWDYTFSTDTWSRKSSFERSAREGAVSFVINGRGFVSMGKASSQYFDDLEEWQPNAALNTND